jgi:hypothetical protein
MVKSRGLSWIALKNQHILAVKGSIVIVVNLTTLLGKIG